MKNNINNKYEYECQMCGDVAQITSYLFGKKRLCTECYKILLVEEDKQLQKDLYAKDDQQEE